MSATLTVQATRYLAVGASGYVLAMGLYSLLLRAGVEPYVAIVPTFVANGAYNFVLARAWAFGPSGLGVRTEVARFCVVAAASLVVNYGAMYLVHDGAGVAAVPAQAIAIIVATPVGFFGNRLWSFASSRQGIV